MTSPLTLRARHDALAGILPAAVLFSGAANLAGEALWHRMASILVGDMSLSTTIVWSVFFLGGALGALCARRYLKFLWVFEAIPAGWSIFWAIAIRGGALEWSLSSTGLALIMLPPAIAMGAHIPAYAILTEGGLAKSWTKWHFGGAIGIFVLAALPIGSLSSLLLALGTLQFLFAAVLFMTTRNMRPSTDTPVEALSRSFRSTIMPVLIGCFAASWMATTLMQLSFLTFPLRIVGATALAASAIAASCGGIRLPSRLRHWIPLFPIGAAATAAVALPASGGLARLLFPQPDSVLFGLSSLLIALLLMTPLAFTGAWYVARAEGKRHGDLGTILAAAAVGNACGFIGFHYAGFAFTATAAFVVTTTILVQRAVLMGGLRAAAIGAASLMASAMLAAAIAKPFDWNDRSAGALSWQSDWSQDQSITIRRTADSWWALTEGTDRQGGRPFHDLTIHGAPSHDLASGVEFASPIIGGSYLTPQHAKRTLVLGILSGQTSAAAASFSDVVDAVDVSPAALDAITQLAHWNGAVANVPKVRFIIDDGLTVLKSCADGSYDLIVNGASSPATSAGAKMFTTETVMIAKRCLRQGGVYMSYLSTASVPGLQAADLLIRPLKNAFKYVDISLDPYPLLIAYDHEVTQQQLAGQSALLQQDGGAFAALAAATAPGMFIIDHGIPKMRQVRILRDYHPSPGPIPTLDNGLAEHLAAPTYLGYWAGHGNSTLKTDLVDLFNLLQKIN